MWESLSVLWPTETCTDTHSVQKPTGIETSYSSLGYVQTPIAQYNLQEIAAPLNNPGNLKADSIGWGIWS